jgi:hypothetical protein
MRGRISILSEAFSHDPFKTRIASTYQFVQEILSLVAERSSAILSLSQRADQQQLAWGHSPDSVQRIPIRTELTTAPPIEGVVAEIMEHTSDSIRTQPGVPRGLRRTGRFQAVRMPVFDRFDPTLEATPPAAYAIPARDTAIVRLLSLHGLSVERLAGDWSSPVESFGIDSVAKALRPFQGHLETRVRGAWRRQTETLPAGTFIVRPSQRRGLLAVYLLEPESEDGLTDWNYLDSELVKNGAFPIRRILTPPPSGTPTSN